MKLNKLKKPRRNSVFALVASLLVTGVSLYLILATFANSGIGVAYNWKTGSVESNFENQSAMPEGWDFVTFTSTLADQTRTNFGIWAPIGSPMIGSRSLSIQDTGDDVLALQKTINAIRTTDDSDEFYFDKVNENGVFDQGTFVAVYTLQDYYGQTSNGVADLNFQSSLYQQVATPE